MAPINFRQTLEAVDALIRAGKPTYFITANLHYAMVTASDPRIPPLNQRAAFVLTDGMPLVWASLWRERRVPERVAGSDLVPALCGWAAQHGYRVFFLGGAPGIAEAAARKLQEQHPNLIVAGFAAPSLDSMTADDLTALVAQIRDARPHLLLAAFGQPKGELWLAEHLEAFGVPVSVQIGASLDFVAGKVPRSPLWMQRSGLEWVYRLYREPRRLMFRYLRNSLFALRMLVRDAFAARSNRK